jgi:3-hydroxybutyryl-CoA dehydrogenase
VESEAEPARSRILGFLKELHDEGLLKESPETVAERITITTEAPGSWQDMKW